MQTVLGLDLPAVSQSVHVWTLNRANWPDDEHSAQLRLYPSHETCAADARKSEALEPMWRSAGASNFSRRVRLHVVGIEMTWAAVVKQQEVQARIGVTSVRSAAAPEHSSVRQVSARDSLFHPAE